MRFLIALFVVLALTAPALAGHSDIDLPGLGQRGEF